MSDIAFLRKEAEDLFKSAVKAANPSLALRAALSKNGFAAPNGGKYIVFAAGKAAVPMMNEALTHLPANAIKEALIITNYENGQVVEGAKLFAAGHPVPDENGADAADHLIKVLTNATAEDHVIALISGGASALLPAPVDEIELADKIKVNEILLKAGFDIIEMNSIRQQLSRLKGGGATRLANPAPIEAYILSDVIGDDLRVIASGPTVAPVASRAEAMALITAKRLEKKLPPRVLRYLLKNDLNDEVFEAQNHLIGSNRMSVDAVAEHASKNGWEVRIVNDALIGDVVAASDQIADAIFACETDDRVCLLFGGETSVDVKGKGLGGRNQELALRIAMKCQSFSQDWVFLSGGTDGRDGPTDAAGGVVDGNSINRLADKQLSPEIFLNDSDSYHALKASKDLLMTGATGTNVADIQIALIKKKN